MIPFRRNPTWLKSSGEASCDNCPTLYNFQLRYEQVSFDACLRQRMTVFLRISLLWHLIGTSVFRTRLSHVVSDTRLLTILPNCTSRSRIECEIFHDNIGVMDRTHYEALWGDVGQTVDIRLNDCVFPATANFEAALRALGKVDKPRVPRVDAICVDQGDWEEQGEQVRVMWDIYKAADRVVVTVRWPWGISLDRILKADLQLVRFGEKGL